jgi:hypothetical protein
VWDSHSRGSRRLFANCRAKDGPMAFVLLILPMLLAISYVTRLPSHAWPPKITAVQLNRESFT